MTGKNFVTIIFEMLIQIYSKIEKKSSISGKKYSHAENEMNEVVVDNTFYCC